MSQQFPSVQSAQNRTFIGAITSAIKAICLLLIRSVDVANTGVAMAADAVDRARDKQVIDTTIERQDYERAAIIRAAVERQKVREAIESYLAADTTGKRRKDIDAETQAITAAINAERARIKTAND